MTTIDLNCDLGEGSGHDGELMQAITSANIACGGHAGDRTSMLEAIDLALASGVLIGGHPGLDDRDGFGRRDLAVDPAAVGDLVVNQVGALIQLARLRGARVAHVKPHGALYHRAARERAVADALATAVRLLDPALILVGPSGSALLAAGRSRGLRVAAEVFADRMYRPDGTLVPRGEPGAVIEDEEAAVAQALKILSEGAAIAADGTPVSLAADTLCVHGDSPQAASLAWRLRTDLGQAGIQVKAL